jgi:tetracycline resistance efflux pump
MSDPTWVSILPPVLAIVLAIATRQVYLSLAGGVWFGWMILEGWNPAAGLATAIERSVGVLAEPGDAKVILFTLVIGSMITTIEAAGGVRGFVSWLETRKWVDSAKRAQMLAWLAGVIIFIESNITVLVAGSVSRPLFDRFKTSREKLAYLIDSTSAPICIMIPLNAWGAYNIALLGSVGLEDPMGTFIASIPLNFYAIVAILLALSTVLFGIDLGPMKKAEERTRAGKLLWPDATPMIDEAVLSPPPNENIPARAINMFVPIGVMVLMMPVSLYITGGGSLANGNGSTSVLWAVLSGLAVSWVMLKAQGAFSLDELTHLALKGAGALIPMATILLLALALKNVALELGTGAYVAQVTQGVLPPVVLLPLVFLVGGGVAFSIGSSWSTFAIMIPIAVPLALTMGLPPAPFVAASLSGGIFGDHCSPISDTTIISSMAAATDHIDHVRTQLPYALLGGAISLVMFAIVGLTL